MEFKMDDREAMAWQMLSHLHSKRLGAYEDIAQIVCVAFEITDAFIAETHARRNEGQR